MFGIFCQCGYADSDSAAYLRLRRRISNFKFQISNFSLFGVGIAGAFHPYLLAECKTQISGTCCVYSLTLLLAGKSVLDSSDYHFGLVRFLSLYSGALAARGTGPALLQDKKDSAIFSSGRIVCRCRTAAGVLFRRLFLAVSGPQPVSKYHPHPDSRHFRHSRAFFSHSDGQWPIG